MNWLLVIWIATWTANYPDNVVCGKDPYTRQNKFCPKEKHAIYRERFKSESDMYEFMAKCPLGVCGDWVVDEVHE